MKIKYLGEHQNPTPRILLFYFAVLVQLFASAISGSGFLLDSAHPLRYRIFSGFFGFL